MNALPDMFKDVMVFGRMENKNVLRQWWQARRWTGHTSGPMPAAWNWLTPTDHLVTDVLTWCELPEVKDDERIELYSYIAEAYS